MTTLADLITLVRQRANVENNEFVTDPELTSYINNSLGELDDTLVTRYEDYKITTILSTLVDGYNQIPLPPDFLKLRAIDFSTGTPTNNNRWFTINQYQMPERNRYNNAAQNILSPWGKVALSARVMGQTIFIEPQDQAGGVYQIWYTPKFTPLVNTTDALPFYMDSQGWSEFAVVGTCVKIMNKMNLDPQGFMAEKAEQKERVISAAKNRDSSGPKRIANVRNGGNGGFSGGFGGCGGFGW